MAKELIRSLDNSKRSDHKHLVTPTILRGNLPLNHDLFRCQAGTKSKANQNHRQQTDNDCFFMIYFPFEKWNRLLFGLHHIIML